MVLDCPPALDLLTLNVLVASNSLIVPMQAEYFALEGITELISTLERVRAAFNHDVDIEGVLLTMYDDRTNLAQQVRDTLREHFKDRLFITVIPRNIRLAEAPSHGKPVALYDSRSRGTEAYFELAGEFLARNKIESPKSVERKEAAEFQAESLRFVSGHTPDGIILLASNTRFTRDCRFKSPGKSAGKGFQDDYRHSRYQAPRPGQRA